MNQQEIKFRAWDMYNEKMIYDVCVIGDMVYKIDNNNAKHITTPVGYDAIIPMQYTGLKDKNGKEICEGDIVEYKNFKRNELFLVKKIAGGFIVITQKEDKSKLPIYDCLAERQTQSWIEQQKVIGNLYENPELLKT